MRKFFTLACIMLMAAALQLWAGKIGDLPELLKPDSLVIDGDLMYIAEQGSIHIYSVNDLKKIKQFGRQGEGPGEYKYLMAPRVYPDRLVMCSRGKVLTFSKDGKFIEEFKCPTPRSRMYPVGENYLATEFKFGGDKPGSMQVKLYDKKINALKTLTLWEINRKPGRFTMIGNDHRQSAVTDGSHIYLADTKKGFFVEIFDSNGNKMRSINKKYEKRKVTDEFKKEFEAKTIHRMKTRGFYERIKNRLNFDYLDYFPAFKSITPRDGKIYVRTFIEKEKKAQTIIVTREGKILETVFLPIKEIMYLHKDKIYYLEENADEEWELHAETI
ncbi:MAG: hypothetical protein GY765_39590 [bacterium]|nr:hypothetical protein [bacterium]